MISCSINKKILPNEIEFMLYTKTPTGCFNSREIINMSLSDIDEYNKDPDLYISKLHRVTKEQYIQWAISCFDPDGYGPICTATTKKGVRCKNLLTHHINAEEYLLDIRSSYCTIHKK